MSPRWERLHAAPPPPAGAVHMDAVLAPNRSLSVRAFTVLIGVFVAINAGLAMLFALQGAYPVLAFLALDVGLVGFCFWLNYRDGRARERVQVAGDRVHVASVPAKGSAAHWIVNPHWARVHQEERSIRIAAGGRDVRVGGFLSPEEREDFARALEAAILRARAER
jgi:uncharacterized membrane protein